MTRSTECDQKTEDGPVIVVSEASAKEKILVEKVSSCESDVPIETIRLKKGVEYESESSVKRFFNSFRRSDVTDSLALQRKLKSRHIQMIAIGSTIGTGLWVGSGDSFAKGGAASVLINYIIVGTMILTTVYSLGELAVNYPVPGSYLSLSSQFVDRSWSFAMHWNYIFGSLVSTPLEIITACMCLTYWTSINSGIWITIFIAFFMFINIFGVKGYGEIEFFLSFIKVVSIIGFIILGIIIDCGGIPTDHRGYIGTRIFESDAFIHGFRGFCAVFLNATYSYSGTECVGLAAAETEDPAKTFPKAVKQTVYRIALFYIVALFIVSLLISGKDPRLVTLSGNMASPFILAVEDAGIKALPSILNAIILISVLSAANAIFYTGSRAIHSAGVNGYGPKWFSYVDRSGRPLAALALLFLFCGLAYLSETNTNYSIFTWLMAVYGLGTLFSWGTINLVHIRMRLAMKRQGVSTTNLIYASPFGIYGSYYSLIWVILMFIAQLYVAIFPFGGKPNASYFFQQYLSMPVIIIMFLVHKLWTKTPWLKLKNIDLDTGLNQSFNVPFEQPQEKTKNEQEGFKRNLSRFLDFLC
ncbi:general amino acid permease GAP1 [Schizosaccharomyces japonicus yFS275]|uniref:General amino acid permease GAP1 n=1 Tax=Schizosaccharomyces japonicus (strain yFS275 / FY16936) TaxID=402676 RepID=B6JZG0_SCHJY|nr:general amino acid permease GAP1 [Schizosaccharomyces japonicus yFS275]EEB06928.1 general amino acid permease GAP1 [Schizosaccharomyces japonicus yFS275]